MEYRILIIESSVLIRNIIRMILLPIPGVTVEEVDDLGKIDPIDLKSGYFTLCVMGFTSIDRDSLGEIREQLKILPVITYGRPAEKESASIISSRTFLERPFYPTDLVLAVRAALGVDHALN